MIGGEKATVIFQYKLTLPGRVFFSFTRKTERQILKLVLNRSDTTLPLLEMF